MEILAFSLVPNLCLKILRTLQTVSVSVIVPLSFTSCKTGGQFRPCGENSIHTSVCQVTCHGNHGKMALPAKSTEGRCRKTRSCLIERANDGRPCSRMKKNPASFLRCAGNSGKKPEHHGGVGPAEGQGCGKRVFRVLQFQHGGDGRDGDLRIRLFEAAAGRHGPA